MTWTLKEFSDAYAAGLLHTDASWRAYDIEAMQTPYRLRLALKHVGYRNAAEVAAAYGLHNTVYAAYILGLWHTWWRISTGRLRRGLILRRAEDERK